MDKITALFTGCRRRCAASCGCVTDVVDKGKNVASGVSEGTAAVEAFGSTEGNVETTLTKVENVQFNVTSITDTAESIGTTVSSGVDAVKKTQVVVERVRTTIAHSSIAKRWELFEQVRKWFAGQSPTLERNDLGGSGEKSSGE
jgi:hypothetical protein